MATQKSPAVAPVVVTAALVQVKRADGSLVYLYRGAVLPSGLATGEVERLTALGMVGETATPVLGEMPRRTAD